MFGRSAVSYCLILLAAAASFAEDQAWKPAGAWQANRPETSTGFREPALLRASSLPAPADSLTAAAAAPVAPAALPTELTTEAAALAAPGAVPAAVAQRLASGPLAAPLNLAQPAAFVQPVAALGGAAGALPNEHGQQWREYDISAYTNSVQGVEHPEQALTDWIIRDTGTQVWFSEPLGLLSANRTTLRVYHTPEMQEVVKNIVDQFVGSKTSPYTYGVRLLTVNNPNWRSRLQRSMRPVSVQTPGIQAWIMSKEDAAILASDLKNRPDYLEYNSTNLIIHNGQSGGLAHVKPNSYIKNVLFSGDAFGSYQPELGQIDEGYSLQISPLVTADGSIIDAVIKCSVDQVEKMVSVNIDVPTQLNAGQQVQIQVPQMVSWRVHERFRWPAEQVLVLSCGVVAKPGGGKAGLFGLTNVPNPLASAPRADALMILECKGTVGSPLVQSLPAGSGVSTPAFQTGAANTYHGRY